MAFGRIEYNKEGLPKCELCGEHFHRVISHVRQKHFLTEKEYKKQFGFDLTRGICSQISKEKSREKTLKNAGTCISQNLIRKGVNTRFKKGDEGRGREKLSEQSKLRLTEQIRRKADLKANGRRLGLSGLGNKARWGKKSEN